MPPVVQEKKSDIIPVNEYSMLVKLLKKELTEYFVRFINGINDDNRIENLRIVCPNCNAGLDTHCAKNKKGIKPKKLCKCGKNIRKESDMCVQCLGKSRKEYKIPYEQLKLDIEELGYAGTGRKYNVSDTTIKNWLENYKELKYEKENETL